MPQAIWNGVVLAESDKTQVVEGNHYFPPESINKAYFRPADTHTTCPWKGVASYYDIVVDSKVNKGGAWYYPNQRPDISPATLLSGEASRWSITVLRPINRFSAGLKNYLTVRIFPLWLERPPGFLNRKDAKSAKVLVFLGLLRVFV
jgi:hypothetical protein